MTDERRPFQAQTESGPGLPPDDSSGEAPPANLRVHFEKWTQFAWRVIGNLGKDQVGFASAGVAFYLLLGFIPTLAAVVSLYGLAADPGDVERQLNSLHGLVPPAALQILGPEMKRLVSDDTSAGFAMAMALLLAIWGGSQATGAMVTALNMAFGETESRGFIRVKATALGLTLGLSISLAATVALLAALPIALAFLPLAGYTGIVIQILKWPAVILILGIAISLLYRFAPDREGSKWRWVSPGSLFATALWTIGSALFSWYASSFGNYSATYGSIAGIVVLLFWFYITGLVIMLV